MRCTGQMQSLSSGGLATTGQADLDLEKWYVSGLPLPLLAACAACQRGVKRAHLVDARMDGALLLELYSRDGVGTMLSADFYEVRTAGQILGPEFCRFAAMEWHGIWLLKGLS